MDGWIIFEGLSFQDATCDVTIESKTVTCNSSSDIVVGQTVVGTGIPYDTNIVAVNSAGSVTSFTLNNRATASNTNITLTFFYSVAKEVHAYPTQNLYAAFITDGVSIVFYVRNPNNIFSENAYPDDKITITTQSGSALLVLDHILKLIAKNSKAPIRLNTSSHADITGIAWEAGAT